MNVGEGIDSSSFSFPKQIATIGLKLGAADLIVEKWESLANFATYAQDDIRTSCSGADCNFTATFSDQTDRQSECRMSCGNCDTDTLRNCVNALGRAVQEVVLCRRLEDETGEVIEPASPSQLLGSDYTLTPVRTRRVEIGTEALKHQPPEPEPRIIVDTTPNPIYL